MDGLPMILCHICNQYLDHITLAAVSQAFCPSILIHDPLSSRFVLQNVFNHLSWSNLKKEHTNTLKQQWNSKYNQTHHDHPFTTFINVIYHSIFKFGICLNWKFAVLTWDRRLSSAVFLVALCCNIMVSSESPSLSALYFDKELLAEELNKSSNHVNI